MKAILNSVTKITDDPHTHTTNSFIENNRAKEGMELNVQLKYGGS